MVVASPAHVILQTCKGVDRHDCSQLCRQGGGREAVLQHAGGPGAAAAHMLLLDLAVHKQLVLVTYCAPQTMALSSVLQCRPGSRRESLSQHVGSPGAAAL